MRAAIESLLRARKLDVTLTSCEPAAVPPGRVAPTGDAEIDAALGGGLRRGHVSEVIGAPSTGRSTLVARLLASATARGEATAVVDASDTWDPISAHAHGVVLERLLWVRERGDALRALKAFSLILQAGGFGLAVLDLADVPVAAIRRFPSTTWMRAARLVEGRDTVALLVGVERIARSAGGATFVLETSRPVWRGTAHRARVFTGVEPAPRVVRAR